MCLRRPLRVVPPTCPHASLLSPCVDICTSLLPKACPTHTLLNSPRTGAADTAQHTSAPHPTPLHLLLPSHQHCCAHNHTLTAAAALTAAAHVAATMACPCLRLPLCPRAVRSCSTSSASACICSWSGSSPSLTSRAAAARSADRLLGSALKKRTCNGCNKCAARTIDQGLHAKPQVMGCKGGFCQVDMCSKI